MLPVTNRRPVLVFACWGVESDAWLKAIRGNLPEVEVREWPDVGDPAEVDLAFVWKYPPGLLGAFPNLRAVFALGAGVESILRDPTYPTGVPLVRMVDPGLATGMNEFVLMCVLHYHRQMHEHARHQKARQWVRLVPPLPGDRRVGLLGLGELGTKCARTLAGLGFDMAGWTRTPRDVPNVTTFAGWDRLPDFLARTEILVCLLPLTADTANILNRERLARLPKSACIVNVARGDHIVDADLIAALDSGHLAGATLDVFREEPLPAAHTYWSHPKVTVVPHIAAITQIKTAAETLAANVRRVLAGQPLPNVVSRERGY